MKTTARTITTIVGGAALLLATAGTARAQEDAPETTKKQTQTQAKKGDGSGQGQARGTQNETGAARKLGPGNGTLSRSRARSRTPSGTCTGARSGRGSDGSRRSGGGDRR